MHQEPLVAAVMTPFPHAVDADSTLGRARQLMEEHDVHHLPVVAGRALVGVLTSRALEVGLARAGEDSSVSEACDRRSLVVDIHRSVSSMLTELAEQHADAALVVKEGRLAGIFTMVDACRYAADLTRKHWPGPGNSVA